MSDHTPNFPGNPFAERSVSAMGDADAIRNAVLILAFEQRTANLINAARPSDLSALSPSQQRRAVSANAEARRRLGRALSTDEALAEESFINGDEPVTAVSIVKGYKEGRA